MNTNLGRAPFSEELTGKVLSCLNGYSNLEYNLESGKRGERYAHFEKLLCEITGAEAAMAVNNNAAAVLLMISALGKGKELIVSRGEQVEIGGKFRVPEIIDQSGLIRVEVGTTNKTHLEDYENAITENTAALLKVHTSNFAMIGFTESVEIETLTALGKERDIPVIQDLGSGVLVDLSEYGLKKEPTVMESIKAGVDLVSFSGDKLLGGPQAGIIVGKKKWIDLCKKHPLTRAVRIDKFTAAMLEATLHIYQDKKRIQQKIPVIAMLTEPVESILKRAEELKDLLGEIEGYSLRVAACDSMAGGGSLPGQVFKSMALYIRSEKKSAYELEKEFRHQVLPLIVRIENDQIILDLRTISQKELVDTAEILKKVLS